MVKGRSPPRWGPCLWAASLCARGQVTEPRGLRALGLSLLVNVPLFLTLYS